MEKLSKKNKPKASDKDSEKVNLKEREFELSAEIQFKLDRPEIRQIHAQYGMMAFIKKQKVKIPFIPQVTSFLQPGDKEIEVARTYVIVWHEDQKYLTRIFKPDSIYYWYWAQGLDIIYIWDKADIDSKIGALISG